MLTVIHSTIPRYGMKGCVRLENSECSEWFEVGQGLRQGCVPSPLWFSICLSLSDGSAKTRTCSWTWCIWMSRERGHHDARPVDNNIHRRCLYCGHRVAKMILFFVDIFGACGLIASEKQPEVMIMPTPGASAMTMRIKAAIQRYDQTQRSSCEVANPKPERFS